MSGIITRVIVCGFIAAFLAANVGAQPQMPRNDSWHWIMVSPSDNHNPVTWQVLQGIAADIRFEGRRFTADLYEADPTVHPGTTPDFILKGTIADRRIVATELKIGTDAGPETYRGTIKTKHVRGDPFETQRILLSGAWTDTFIGITRYVRAVQPD